MQVTERPQAWKRLLPAAAIAITLVAIEALTVPAPLGAQRFVYRPENDQFTLGYARLWLVYREYSSATGSWRVVDS
jgi:hypothetical protein